MRLFTGISLPPSVPGNLEQLLEHLRPSARLSWAPTNNLHITTRFIGEWPNGRLQEITSALEPLRNRPGIPLTISGLGWFPDARSPKIFWAGVKAPPALSELARDTDAALESLGLIREAKQYRPHLTLARVKGSNPLELLRHTIAALPSLEFGEFLADRFCLYRSEPGGSHSIYTRLAEFPFTQS